MRKQHPIGAKIKALRLKRCWTQAQAATMLSISLRTLISLEKGNYRGEPRPLTLAKINLAIQSIEKVA
jgi:DNA-binding XRE family transcriptional regulator